MALAPAESGNDLAKTMQKDCPRNTRMTRKLIEKRFIWIWSYKSLFSEGIFTLFSQPNGLASKKWTETQAAVMSFFVVCFSKATGER